MLYRIALREAFDAMPLALQRIHSDNPVTRYSGTARIEHDTWPARLLARMIGYPSATGTIPIKLVIRRNGTTEIWQRYFGDHMVRSVQRPGPDATILEALGPITVILKPQLTNGVLNIPMVGMRVMGLPVPRSLLRSGGGVEVAESNGISFDVSASAFGLGRIIRYSGTLRPDQGQSAA